MDKLAVAEYYLTSSHKKAQDFRKNSAYKKILNFAFKGKFKVNDIYQKTDVVEGKKERGRIIGTMIKNLVTWGFLVKTGEKDYLYRQEFFTLNDSLKQQVRRFIEK